MDLAVGPAADSAGPAVVHLTPGTDPDLLRLVAEQEAEVMARYGVDDPGPGLSEHAPWLLARLDGQAVACVALGHLGDLVGEVKRMYVAPSARGRGLARMLLQSLEDLAVARGYRLLRLETGTQQPEALRLYETSGWSRIDCYGYFANDPSTICYQKVIAPKSGSSA